MRIGGRPSPFALWPLPHHRPPGGRGLDAGAASQRETYMDNNNAQTALPTGTFGDDEYFEETLRARWKLWLSMGLWDYREALRLLVCEPKPCQGIVECVKDFEDGFRNKEFYPDDLYACFYHQINDTSSKIYAAFALYKSEAWSQYGFSDDNFPERISPKIFIEWALSKDKNVVPQEMMDWYNVYQTRNKAALKVPDTATTPKPKKRRDAVKQKDAALRLGVSERTIRNWEKGKNTPDWYRGRRELTPFVISARDKETAEALKEDARQQNRAVSAGDMSEYSEAYEDE